MMTLNSNDCIIEIDDIVNSNDVINVIDDLCEEKNIGEIPICRICLQDDSENNLISPCRCSGTANYVHMECLNEWRNLSTNPLASSKCLVCNTPYRLVSIQHHFFRNWCIFINYSTTVVFIHQHLAAFFMTVFIGSTIPLHEDSLKNHSPSEYYKSIMRIYVICILSMITLMLLYTLYVFIRYAARHDRKKLCYEIMDSVCAHMVPCAVFGLTMYLIIPEFLTIIALVFIWFIDDLMLQTFKSIEKGNRRYSGQVILDRE